VGSEGEEFDGDDFIAGDFPGGEGSGLFEEVVEGHLEVPRAIATGFIYIRTRGFTFNWKPEVGRTVL